jgi:hypothetical protein
MSVEAYLTARANFIEVVQKIENAAKNIIAVGSALRQYPGQLGFSNASVGLPSRAFAGQTFNADDWKSADQIQQILLEWHTARDVMNQAWQAVPRNLQGGLQPPVQ